jgi:hypothetical protein
MSRIIDAMLETAKDLKMDSITIKEEDFIDRVKKKEENFELFNFNFFYFKARQLKINNVKSFYDSEIFKMMKFHL